MHWCGNLHALTFLNAAHLWSGPPGVINLYLSVFDGFVGQIERASSMSAVFWIGEKRASTHMYVAAADGHNFVFRASSWPLLHFRALQSQSR
jgi:hypothetical protein